MIALDIFCIKEEGAAEYLKNINGQARITYFTNEYDLESSTLKTIP
jgi:hypothetical protein